jgi:putative oxidoreductase
MNIVAAIARPAGMLDRGLQSLQSLVALATRCWVSWQFLKSGMLKLEDWETTLFLFQEEYRTPVLSPQLAAIAGTAGEIFFPLLLISGLFGRLAAVGLLAVNVMAVVAYAHVLLTPVSRQRLASITSGLHARDPRGLVPAVTRLTRGSGRGSGARTDSRTIPERRSDGVPR